LILNSLGVDQYRFGRIGVVLAWLQLSMMLATGLFAESPNPQHRVRDRLWLWTHPAGCYNNDFIKNRSQKSSIEPVDAVQTMELRMPEATSTTIKRRDAGRLFSSLGRIGSAGSA